MKEESVPIGLKIYKKIERHNKTKFLHGCSTKKSHVLLKF